MPRFDAKSGLAVLLYLLSTVASADAGDLISATIGVNRSHLDNIFKRPSDGSRGIVASDRLTTKQLGLSIKKAISLQSFELGATLTDNRYEQQQGLDSRNTGYNVAWRWQLSPYLNGALSATRQQAQTDFADFRGTGQNLRTTDTRRASVDFKVGGGWVIGVGATKTIQSNSQAFNQDPGSDQDAGDISLRYGFKSGASIALTASRSRGDYHRSPDPITQSDSRFTELRKQLQLELPLTEKLRASLGLGNLERANENFSVRDFRGRNHNVSLSWALTQKLNLTLVQSTASESWQDNAGSFSVRDSSSLGASWTVLPKVTVRARHDRENRSFDGFALVPAAVGQVEQSKKSSFSVDWAARNNFSISLTAQGSRRNSNAAGLDYRDRTTTLGASFQI